MGLFSKWKISDSIDIKASPEEIWNFFECLEKNYHDWHPEEHILFQWIGQPMRTGTKWYAEEKVHGNLFKLKGTIGEVIPLKKIVFKYSFPVSLAAPSFEWIIEERESGSVFTANSYLNAGDLFNLIGRKEMEWKIPAVKKHTKEEGENLKMILESR